MIGTVVNRHWFGTCRLVQLSVPEAIGEIPNTERLTGESTPVHNQDAVKCTRACSFGQVGGCSRSLEMARTFLFVVGKHGLEWSFELGEATFVVAAGFFGQVTHWQMAGWEA